MKAERIQAYVKKETKEAIINMALEEGRSESNMAGKILDEAIVKSNIIDKKDARVSSLQKMP